MKIIAIIPARGGSKAIPKKNLIDLCGKPLIEWSIIQALKSKNIDKVYVTTDNAEISKVARSAGAEIIIRPKKIAGDKSSSEEALMHALDWIIQNKGGKPDLVVFLQATSPLRKPGDIDNAIKKIITDRADSLMSGSILEDFLIWEKKNNKWKSINYDYKSRGIRQNRDTQYVENGSIYIFKPSVFFKNKNRISGKITLYPMEFWQTWEIDDFESLELVEYYFKKRIKK